MGAESWKEIVAAKEVLGLGDRATLQQIKAAYRCLSKQFHPDMMNGADARRGEGKMHELNNAYATLMKFCQNYSYSLVPDENQPMSGEEWWLDRFGNDPLWGKN